MKKNSPAPIVATATQDFVRHQIPNLVQEMQASQVRLMRQNGWDRGATLTGDMGGQRIWAIRGYAISLWDLDRDCPLYLIDGKPKPF